MDETRLVYQLIYASSASELFSPEELRLLLQQSERNNRGLNITGLLLYKDGNLMQLLEGDEGAVSKLYSKIAQDPRHRGAIILLRRYVEMRLFDHWSMGYRNLSDEAARALPGFSDVFDRPLDSLEWAEGDKCLRLMRIFREKM